MTKTKMKIGDWFYGYEGNKAYQMLNNDLAKDYHFVGKFICRHCKLARLMYGR